MKSASIFRLGPMLACSLATVAALSGGCSSTTDGTGGGGTTTSTSSASTTTSGSTSTTTTTNGNACGALGGICVGISSDCTAAGGTVLPGGASGCVYDDGPGTCCQPPAAQSTGDSCTAHGGLCAPISGCNFVDGAFAPPDCSGVGVVCCVPNSRCGDETVACCNAMTTYRAACDRGTWKCTIPDTTLKPVGQCP